MTILLGKTQILLKELERTEKHAKRYHAYVISKIHTERPSTGQRVQVFLQKHRLHFAYFQYLPISVTTV